VAATHLDNLSKIKKNKKLILLIFHMAKWKKIASGTSSYHQLQKVKIYLHVVSNGSIVWKRESYRKLKVWVTEITARTLRFKITRKGKKHTSSNSKYI
jgi:hypothetical protein